MDSKTEHEKMTAGSVVLKDIPAHVMAAGNPCRVIRNL
jgi:acetyltransferase-like isoleucine patch superfamily enzyme